MQRPELTEADYKLLRDTASSDLNVATAAQKKIAQAIERPLRKGIMAGDILDGIYTVENMLPGCSPEYPLDPLQPGTEKEMVAYTISRTGYIPQRSMEADYVTVQTYMVANAQDWSLRLARDARWPIIGRFMEIFEGGFVKKMNSDGWHTILASAANRDLQIYDGNAASGRFTLRAISLGQQVMRRKAGGNTTSIRQGKLTDLYLSIEGLEDMRSWTLAEIDEVTRREIFTAEDGVIKRIYGVNLHELFEFGVGQEYQTYWTNTLAGTLNAGDVELAIGLDLSHDDSFMMPIREALKVFDDMTMHRQQKAGVYGWSEVGFASLDDRRLLSLSY
jgi:hypothetical protein